MSLPPDSDLGPKMLACTERERRFVWLFVTGDGNATQAAREAGFPDNGKTGIRVRAHELTHRPRVQDAIREVALREFSNLLPAAVRAAAALIANDKHPDHAGMVKSTFSRLGLAEKTGVDVTVAGEVTVNHTDQAIELLRTMLELNVPREKLIEQFGIGGLSRYERMLAERRPKVIEHDGGA
jgi:hypothetical protein